MRITLFSSLSGRWRSEGSSLIALDTDEWEEDEEIGCKNIPTDVQYKFIASSLTIPNILRTEQFLRG